MGLTLPSRPHRLKGRTLEARLAQQAQDIAQELVEHVCASQDTASRDMGHSGPVQLSKGLVLYLRGRLWICTCTLQPASCRATGIRVHATSVLLHFRDKCLTQGLDVHIRSR